MKIKLTDLKKMVVTKGIFGGAIFYVLTNNGALYQCKVTCRHDVANNNWIYCPGWFVEDGDDTCIETYDTDSSCIFIKKQSDGKPWRPMTIYAQMKGNFTKESITKFAERMDDKFENEN